MTEKLTRSIAAPVVDRPRRAAIALCVALSVAL